MSLPRLVVAIIALLAFAGTATAGEPRDWTVMVFLNGDNNLDEAGVADVNEMERVGSTDRVAVVVQHDRAGDGGTRRFLVEKDDGDEIASPVLETLPEVDMGDWRQAVDFFRWATERFPARRYLFVFWNHGLGWEDKAGEALFKGISYDDDSGNHIRTEDLARCTAAMETCIGRKVDVLGFDACLMQMAEVAAEVAPHVTYQVAAEEIEPGGGWPYEDMLSALVADPSMTPAALSRCLVDRYLASYQGGSQGTEATDQSALRLEGMEALREGLDDLAEAIMAAPAHLGSVLDAGRDAQAFAKPQYKDLGDFLRLLARRAEAPAVRGEAEKLARVLREQVVHHAGATGAKLAGATGLSFWFPTRRQWKSLRLRYGRLRLSREGKWDEALEALHAPKGPVLRIAEIESDGNGPVVPGSELSLRVRLVNEGGSASSALRVALASDDPMLEVLDAGADLGVLEAGAKASSPVLRLRVHPDCPEGREIAATVRLADGEGHRWTRPVKIAVKKGFVPATSVLLVVLSPGHPLTAASTAALRDAGVSFDLWPMDDYGPPSPSALAHYVDGAVVFHAASPGDLGKVGPERLAGYLTAGGALFLTGQDVAYKLKNKDFLERHLHARFVQDNVGCEAVTGEGCFASFRADLVGGDANPGQKWLDEIDPLGPAEVLLRYGKALPGKGPISSACAGLAVNDGASRVVYLAFGLDAVASAAGRAELTRLAMGHLLEGKDGCVSPRRGGVLLAGDGVLLRSLGFDDARRGRDEASRSPRRRAFAELHGR